MMEGSSRRIQGGRGGGKEGGRKEGGREGGREEGGKEGGRKEGEEGAHLFECVFAEESQELKDRECWVELHPLEVGRHKPVEKVAALSKESEEAKTQKYM